MARCTKFPRLVIDLRKIEQNTRAIAQLASGYGIFVTGVTKAACGDPRIARAMLKGGAVSKGDSRIGNIKGLKDAGIEAELMLLRTPMLSEVEDVVKYADISLNSELEVVRRLSREAEKRGVVHKVLLMVEMGELREGLKVKELDRAVTRVLELHGIELHGLGMNLACLSGLIPTPNKVMEFEELVQRIEKRFEVRFEMIGSGNSANIPLLLNGVDHPRTNNLRIGEGILLGLETVNRTPIPNTYQDAFELETEIIELKEKPSIPDGEISQNAFGETPVFKDMGVINRALLAIGRQDVNVSGLEPLDAEVSILWSSSDHIVVHMPTGKYKVGDIVSFRMNYGALVNLFTSEYVGKKYLD